MEADARADIAAAEALAAKPAPAPPGPLARGDSLKLMNSHHLSPVKRPIEEVSAKGSDEEARVDGDGDDSDDAATNIVVKKGRPNSKKPVPPKKRK